MDILITPSYSNYGTFNDNLLDQEMRRIMDNLQPSQDDRQEEEQTYDLGRILSGKCPRCGTDLQIDSRRPKVGAPDDRICCPTCGFSFDLSEVTSFNLGDYDVDLNLQPGWLTALRSGRLPNFTLRNKDGIETPLSDWIRNTFTIFRACNLIISIIITIIFIVFLLWK
jgi:hypothetical protein